MANFTFDSKEVQDRIKEWTAAPYDEATRKELEALLAGGQKDELLDRFYQTVAFGTGGLRGKLGAGTNRMNAYIVARATQGLATYVKAHTDKAGPLRVAIAHDSRHRSREFAEATAGVFAANGFEVFISPELRPTPYLSFAVRHLGCHTGVMVTASHNPKEYNGYKVYWHDGSQVVPPHDKGIITEVNKVVSEAQVKRIAFADGVAQGKIHIMGKDIDDAFLAAVLKQRFSPETIRANDPKIVYTPLHGVGGTMVPKALEQWGFRNITLEPEQMKPNGDFPTAASPNPEEGAALDRAVTLAKKVGAELVLATDPDADRLGIAVAHKGEFPLLTGNQTAALVVDYIIEQNVKAGRVQGKPGVVTTVVTTPLVQKVAHARGAECPLVLTGFKWIAEEIRAWAKPGRPKFLMGTEESYGYLIGDHVMDKDAVVASCVVAEMAAHAKAEGKTLVDKLHDIYEKLGVHYEFQKSITLPGVAGAAKIQEILDGVRRNPPTAIGGVPVVRFANYESGDIFEKGVKIGTTGLPKSDVFMFDLEGGTRGIVRPSGTEPKIKFYFFMCDASAPGKNGTIEDRIAKLAKQAPGFEKDFLAAIGYKG